MKRLQTRVSNLEQLPGSGAQVVAWYDEDELPGQVRISGSDEHIPLDEFRARYPGALLIVIQRVHREIRDD